jgi:hypothetical protein
MFTMCCFFDVVDNVSTTIPYVATTADRNDTAVYCKTATIGHG